MVNTRPLATRKEVAQFLRVSVQRMEQWAHRGKGPRFTKVGRLVRYDWADVEKWLTAQEAGGEKAA
jgi:excisionase family DNA binding protein